MAETQSQPVTNSLWKNILVPTDFSPPADAALAYALALAQASGRDTACLPRGASSACA